MIISKAEAARRIQVTYQTIQHWYEEKPRPEFFIDVSGKTMIDDSHPDYIAREEKASVNFERRLKKNQQLSNTWKKKKKEKQNISDEENQESVDIEDNEYPSDDLSARSHQADLERIIFTTKIQEEKSKQEEIKTLELMKRLAPIEIVKHLFSFGENIIQRMYSRPYEISPQLSAFYKAGEDEKAVNMIRKEIESIIKEAHQELLQELEDDGFTIL